MAAPRGRQCHPAERVLDRNRLGTETFEVVQVLGQQLLGALELVSQRPPDLEVVGECLAQRAHAAPPGHGSASS